MCALAGPKKRLCIRGKLQTVGTSTAHSIGKFVIIEQFEPDKVALVARLELGTMAPTCHQANSFTNLAARTCQVSQSMCVYLWLFHPLM